MTNTPKTVALLAAVPLRLQLTGRIRNLSRPRQWLMAVAEAIQNAMDAIEDSGRTGGIEVNIERGEDLLSAMGGTGPVRNVVVKDTGVGFNKANFDSFCTPDSLHKHTRGGKGLGRLICLQVFERVEGSSDYSDGDLVATREFVLQSECPEISHRVTAVQTREHQTEVKLTGLRDEYQASATMPFGKLVDWLGQHFLPALVERPKWLGKLVIRDGEKWVDLTEKISGGALWTETFELKNYAFQAGCYAFEHEEGSDQVRIVAGGRIVDANTRGLEHYLPHLDSVADDKGHVLLVRSAFFDEHVNDARNGVSFVEEGEENALLGVSAAQFRDSLSSVLKRQLSARLQRSDDKLKSRIAELVRKDALYYLPLLAGYYYSKEFGILSAAVRDEEILASLDAYKRRIATSLKKESRRLAKLSAESADYREGARRLASQIETQKKVALAEYIALRKIVLDRLEQLLDAKGDGKAEIERSIHDLVFPQRSDSESAPGIEHQLWILDERLESHAYLASDKPIDANKGDRPDLLIALDRPGAFASDATPRAKGYERIAIIEFKRALTDLASVPTDKLPHRQMMRYAHQIDTGKAVHVSSLRPVKTTVDVRFYFYAVCEISAGLLSRLNREEGFTPSPTGDGAFAVLNNGRYYVEYISLPKLLEDAKARNLAFFRRIGLEA